MGSEDRIVWLNNGSSDLRGRINAEFEFAFLAVVDGQAFHQQGAKTRAGAAAKGVEDKETLQTRTAVGDTSDLVEDLVNELFADGVMASGVVVGSIFFASDHVLRVEKAAIFAGADFVDDIGFQVTIDCAGNVFALACGGC